MPKIINTNNLSIDGLNTRLNNLDSQYTDLAKKYSILQDSVQSLNHSIIKADLATSFYTTHLATYTAIIVALFILVVTILTAINYYKLYEPIIKTINKLENKTIPDLIRSLRAEHNKEIIAMKQTSLEQKRAIGVAISNAHRGMIMFYKEKNDSGGTFLFLTRGIKASFENSIEKRPLTTKMLEALNLISSEDLFKSGTLTEEYHKEIIESLNYLAKFNNGEYSEFILGVRMNMEKSKLKNHTKLAVNP